MSAVHQPLSMRPLGQNNSQIGGHNNRQAKKLPKVTACSADSTGLENGGSNNSEALMVKKPHHHSVKKLQTATVVKRNLRERTRVRGVNDGFGNLKLHVPNLKSKSSKVETLRGAIDYIKRLKEMLGEDISDIVSPGTPSRECKFEDDDDSSSNISDLTDTQFSPTGSSSSTSLNIKTERSPDVGINPLVYGLPYAEEIYSAPLVPLSTLTPPSLSSLTPIHPEKLPSMSVTAPSWWPESNKGFQS